MDNDEPAVYYITPPPTEADFLIEALRVAIAKLQQPPIGMTDEQVLLIISCLLNGP